MDLRLAPTTMPVSGRPALLPRTSAAASPEAGFTGALTSALHEVSSAQNQANQMQRDVQMESPTVSLEETMVAIQKAQIGFQATLHVRNRMVQAYTDIMNMQV